MSSAGQNIKDVLQEAGEIMEALSPAVNAISRFFGWGRKRSVRALADYVNPDKPTDPKIAMLLDAGTPNALIGGVSYADQADNRSMTSDPS